MWNICEDCNKIVAEWNYIDAKSNISTFRQIATKKRMLKTSILFLYIKQIYF